jgi:hypothetical protein
MHRMNRSISAQAILLQIENPNLEVADRPGDGAEAAGTTRQR